MIEFVGAEIIVFHQNLEFDTNLNFTRFEFVKHEIIHLNIPAMMPCPLPTLLLLDINLGVSLEWKGFNHMASQDALMTHVMSKFQGTEGRIVRG